MAFGVKDPIMSLAVLSAVAFYGASWGSWGLSPHSSDGILPDWAHAGVAVVMTVLGLGILGGLALRFLRHQRESVRPLQVSFIGLLLGMVMVAVVQKEPTNFYAVSAGVMASLILALAAGSMGSVHD